MCQQAIEKLVKGLYVLYVDDHIPHVHAIRQIIRKFEADLPESVSPERYELFDCLLKLQPEGLDRVDDGFRRIVRRLVKSQTFKTAFGRFFSHFVLRCVFAFIPVCAPVYPCARE
jgi:hypothetical protein